VRTITLQDFRVVGPFRQGRPLPLPTPELDDYERELRARSHRKVLYTGIACIFLVSPLLVLGGLMFVPDWIDHAKHPLHGPRPETRAAVMSVVEAARARAAGEEKAMNEAFPKAVAEGVTAHPELGRCPYSARERASAYDFAPSPYARSTDKSLCRACATLRADADALAHTLDQKSRDEHLDDELREKARALEAESVLGYSLVFRSTGEGAPSGVPHHGFVPGYVRGVVYLWSFARHEVVCAGEIQAENSESVDYTYETRGGVDMGSSFSGLRVALERDLRKRTDDAVLSGARYVSGPRIEGED
jgi:hypothetical protein